MKRLWISDEARADLVSIRAFTTQEWGQAQAKSYVEAIKARMARLPERPSLGVACDEVVPGLRRLMVASHTVFYAERERFIVIARVLHQRTEYGRHLRGLPEDPS